MDFTKIKSVCASKYIIKRWKWEKYLKIICLLSLVSSIKNSCNSTERDKKLNQKNEQKTWTNIHSKTYKWPSNTWKDSQHHWSLKIYQIKTTMRHHFPASMGWLYQTINNNKGTEAAKSTTCTWTSGCSRPYVFSLVK